MSTRWLEEEYPKGKREHIVKLEISDKKLNGALKLDGFIKLEELHCSNNELTSLDVSNCSKLTYLDVNYNQIRDLSLPKNEVGLKYLNLLNNNLPEQDLNLFGKFINLKELHIGTIGDDSEVYNHFHGSLEPLKFLTKLEMLSINNTDIDSGLEYLPTSVKNLRCLADRPNAKVKIINMQLEKFAIDKVDAFQGRYNLKAWRDYQRIEIEKEILQEQLDNLIKELTSNQEEHLYIQQIELEAKQEELKAKKFQLDREVTILKQQVDALKADIKQKENELKNLTAQKLTEKLQKEENDRKRNLDLIREAKVELENKLGVVDKELRNKNDVIVDLENQRLQIISEIDSIKIEKENLKRLNEGLKICGGKFSVDLGNHLKKLKEGLSSKGLQKKVKQKNDELEKVRKNGRNLQKEKDSLIITINKLQKELSSADKTLGNESPREKELEEKLGEIIRSVPQIVTKKIELKESINIIREDLSKKRKPLLEELLKEVNGGSTSEKLESIKKDLCTELPENVIQDLLNKQVEVNRLWYHWKPKE
ncbi:5893_t:CDS:1 [Funneliformis mosseae]|uniref:5893_t:CDS:1 n=1 Tax=Funneliformis mosseae TaxID=27381 RepID=A0A9N9FUX7_FUNMO|nr:5893_t:CDS:1 [Funneliformis mosseae]